ncbi:hypothetical protein OL548_13740 [Lysinibacillus sp. MHQ-1]|nr:hypothetical protein OL548_13740 [Lysinibacillus sp. MHQ-1]
MTIIFALIPPIQHYYKLSIPTVDAEIDISAYQPFTQDNQVVKPDEKSLITIDRVITTIRWSHSYVSFICSLC